MSDDDRHPCQRLRDALQRGEGKVFSVGLYALLRASSLATLDDLTHRVEVTLDGMLAHSRVAIFEQDAGFRSRLPEGQDYLLVSRNLDTSSLATTFPFSSSTLTMERGVLYGIAKHNASPVIFDPFDPSLEKRRRRRLRQIRRRTGHHRASIVAP